MSDWLSILDRLFTHGSDIVFFTGAGISTLSGIPDFRGSNGLNQNKLSYPIEFILSNTFFYQDTQAFYDFYRSYMVYQNATSNIAHHFIAKMQKQNKVIAVITQNIDNLHEAAYPYDVIKLHGDINTNYCVSCHKQYNLKDIMIMKLPKCDCGGLIKPDVVLYEEPLKTEVIKQAINKINNAKHLIVVGSSLTVYPAAGLLNYFDGESLIIINKDKTTFDNQADLVINQDIAEVFYQVDLLESNRSAC
ncbi:MAG: NAD-dependent protein deacylase [Erysipelotrichaceae bacterium]|nr:NAD-dependent protein deacylase [Erysipelotrichaceae bacterium]